MSQDPKKCPVSHLTTAFGAPVTDNQNSLTAGARGPLLAQDLWLNEKLANFVREVIPERRMHAKGSGAFGTFTVTHDISAYTRAKIFSAVGKKTEMFARFSTVAGERGAADAERDIRGFALKFYTEEGNWDLVGNNTPVFFMRDPRKFPDLNKAVKRDPKTNLRSATNNWDFWTLLPEALHQVTIVMSDRGIPKSYRHMHGFGSHTYSLINANNERFWVKFHFRTQQGIENLTDTEAAAVVAADRESSQRDLFDAIEKGDFPKWKLQVQIMPETDAEKVPYHPFDLTKVWPHGDYPLIDVGEFELNRNSPLAFMSEDKLFELRNRYNPSLDLSFLYPYTTLDIPGLIQPEITIPPAASIIQDLPLKLENRPETGYYVQIGCFSSEANARKRTEEIRGLNISAIYFEDKNKKNTPWVVASGPYSSIAEAETLKSILAQKSVDSFITRY